MSHRIRIKVDAFRNLSALYPEVPVSLDRLCEIAFGTTGTDADSAVLLSYSVAGGAQQQVDLTSLTGPAGETVSLDLVHGLFVWTDTASAQIALKDGSSNPWAGLGTDYSIPIGAGGLFSLIVTAGYATSGSSKTLEIDNDGASAATVYLLIIGQD